jgi:Uma2 family endonuclease
VSLEEVLTDPALRQRGLTRSQFDLLVGAGLLDGERVELLEGVLVEVVPQGPEHYDAVLQLNRHLTRHLPEPWYVGVQGPLAATERSEPEPDLAVVQRSPKALPTSAALVIEVAWSTQRTDLQHKPGIYAAAGVDQYWVLDLPRREVVVHTEPGDAGYATVRRLPWTAPLSVLGVEVDLAALLAEG